MTSTETEREVGKEKDKEVNMDITEDEEKELLKDNVSGNVEDELQNVDPAEEALVRKLLDDTDRMDVEIEEKREEVVEKRDEVEEKREEEVAKGADNEKGEEVGFQTVEKKRRRRKEEGVRERGTEEEERVEVEEMGGGEKGMEKEAVGMEKGVEKAEVGKEIVGEKGDAKEVEEKGREWIVWWENDLAEVVVGKGWTMEKIRGAGRVEKGLFERLFKVGKAFVRSGDKWRLDGEDWARVTYGERDRELNSLRIVMEIALRFCGEEEGGVDTRVSDVLWHSMTVFEKLELKIAKRHVCQGMEHKKPTLLK